MVREASDIAESPALVAMVRDSSIHQAKSALFVTNLQMGLEHLEVVDAEGVSLGYQPKTGTGLDREWQTELNS